MKKILLIVGLFLSLFLSVFNPTIARERGLVSTVFASGVENSGNTMDDSVQVVRGEDGLLYLSTSSTPSGTLELDSRRVSILPGITVPTGFAETLDDWITAVLTIVIAIAALLVLYNLIYGAILWITSGGDKGKIDQARQRMVAAVIGLIIVASSFAIFLTVIRFLGFQSVSEVFQIKTLDTSETTVDGRRLKPATSSGILRTPSSTTTSTSTRGGLQ